eukprot:gb/GEZN01021716.1/.p1 GENE.gb/GEZN01021716.1/~~gb/GEZN01021716.1/.p1  ORF type:complete len:127 (-),score=33.22 gb/GEZN01021716.1/:226-606(-)
MSSQPLGTGHMGGIPVADEEVQEALAKMFEKLGAYINGELTASAQDYQLLEKLNKVATEKYKGMTEKAVELLRVMDDINKQNLDLEPHLEQILLLNNNIIQLEEIVMQLDKYTQNLEVQFKRAYRR